MELFFEFAGFGCGESVQFVLDAGYFAGDGCWFQCGFVCGEFGLLCGVEDACFEESVVGGAG